MLSVWVGSGWIEVKTHIISLQTCKDNHFFKKVFLTILWAARFCFLINTLKIREYILFLCFVRKSSKVHETIQNSAIPYHFHSPHQRLVLPISQSKLLVTDAIGWKKRAKQNRK